MRECNLAIVGGGPAGLAAALRAAELGLEDIVLLERDDFLGGQLVKQTHKFFGAHDEYAGMRGIEIAEHFRQKLSQKDEVDVLLGSPAQGFYEDDVLTYTDGEKMNRLKPERLILAPGASEKMLAFPGNDLPGVYGAGAVQTLMNQYGIRPGENVLMVGGGNIGLIVAYQLLQADIGVAAVVEAENKVGGYAVHATKIRRCGVPILTRHTLIRARGEREVEGAVIQEIDENWQPAAGTERELDVDTICLAVGLSPQVDLAVQAGCEMVYSPLLGGDVPWRDSSLRTSREMVFVAGDAAGVEEATAAILEGELSAARAAEDIFQKKSGPTDRFSDAIEKARESGREARAGLEELRGGPISSEIREGIARLRRKKDVEKDRYSRRS